MTNKPTPSETGKMPFDDVLRRMLATPPAPYVKKKSAAKRKPQSVDGAEK